MTDIQLPSKEGFGSSVSWTPCGNFLARVSGESIHIVDSRCAFTLCAQIQIPGNSFRSIAFSPKYESPSLGEDGLQYCYKLAGVGLDGRLCLIQFNTPDNLTVVHSISVEENLWTLRWSAGRAFLRVTTTDWLCSLLLTTVFLHFTQMASTSQQVARENLYHSSRQTATPSSLSKPQNWMVEFGILDSFRKGQRRPKMKM